METAAPGTQPTVASKRRAQAQRATARHVAWLNQLMRGKAVHHTSSGQPRPEDIAFQARISTLELEVLRRPVAQLVAKRTEPFIVDPRKPNQGPGRAQKTKKLLAVVSQDFVMADTARQ